MYDHLRSSPVYQNALRAPSAFALYPAAWIKRRRLTNDYLVQTAATRLDHLIKNSLDPQFSFIDYAHVSAMMTFLECFERDFPNWRLSAQTHSIIDPRIELCKQIIEQRRQDCEARHADPPSSAFFREVVIRNAGTYFRAHALRNNDEMVDRVVYDNPCYNDYYVSVSKSVLYWSLDLYWGDPISIIY